MPCGAQKSKIETPKSKIAPPPSSSTSHVNRGLLLANGSILSNTKGEDASSLTSRFSIEQATEG